jgi:hypothetical protein
MLLVVPNIFIGYSTCLVFDLQWVQKIEVSSFRKNGLFDKLTSHSKFLR